jgi:hypothetical protein
LLELQSGAKVFFVHLHTHTHTQAFLALSGSALVNTLAFVTNGEALSGVMAPALIILSAVPIVFVDAPLLATRNMGSSDQVCRVLRGLCDLHCDYGNRCGGWNGTNDLTSSTET